ncbi:NAD(P)H-quinone oxidoreductase subunit M [Candidatus Atelocyanobacterium thalassae]|uniref:NAD(P)H-quinone oxidoreductase subunit M n=2 Tax=Candidatus Atelocyanobacterium thalassae TaxID=713887 RepID=A0A086CIJ6_9CHRO|nr:NAD(P)H-quinone oxidoreductase subunit M [Candidatus Atelocyanobacterium thalassa]KFF42010.1 MAG: Cyanobacterial and plastid NDH-1 subunit M [Candidatus Atelocyanobacterium thalassa isolate SIO64986]BDA39824.1 NAD(P)H-quinone oxidoreductase subunit M [cyanobacterium endosymbiont of Braarudosphaera bigelowii]
MLVKYTTRHVRIFTAEVKENELVENDKILTLDIDPDNEFIWNEDILEKVYRKFDELIEFSSGEDLTDYNLNYIGSSLEDFIRDLLQKGDISYNLGGRSPNYSMGLPRVRNLETEGKYNL